MHHVTWGVAVGLALAGAAGCYGFEPSGSSCLIACADGACPSGLTCNANGVCGETATSCMAAIDAGGTGVDASLDAAPIPREPHDFVRINAGSFHVCAIDVAGALWCWGDDVLGQVTGDPAGPRDEREPVQVTVAAPGGRWLSVSAGSGHTCGVYAPASGPNELWCWGQSFNDELGTDENVSVNRVPAPAGRDWTTQVDAGSAHTCAIASGSGDARVFCWGLREAGALGLSPPTGSTATPTEIVAVAEPLLVDAGGATRDTLHVGDQFACVIRTTGEAACWGDTSTAAAGAAASPCPACRYTAANIASTFFTSLAGGNSFTCASPQVPGPVQCWGDNGYGQLAAGSPAQSAIPVPISNVSQASRLSANSYSACALTTAGVQCWGGANNFGERGTGRFGGLLNANATLAVLGGRTPVEVARGFEFSCALVDDGDLDPSNGNDAVCWGRNELGQLGNGTRSIAPTPSEVSRPNATGVWKEVAAGDEFTCGVFGASGVATDRQVYCWGRNVDGEATGAPTPLDVRRPASPLTINGDLVDDEIELAAGSRHACAVRPGGVACWGNNAQNQLGEFNTADHQAMLAVTAARITASMTETCATKLAPPAETSCWGDGWSQSEGPSVRSELDGARLVNLGNGVACYDSGGSATCQGGNAFGQLGHMMSGVFPVGGLTAAVQSWARGRGDHRCAIAGPVGTAALYCWGANAYGQTGAAVVAAQFGAIQVGTATNWSSVAVGRDFTCGVAGGAASCWGYNDRGQLGGSPRTETSTPQPVDGTWVSVTAGDKHACAIDTAGDLHCWGEGGRGQLGTGVGDAALPEAVRGVIASP